MKRIFLIFLVLFLVPTFSYGTTVLYRISSGEVISISISDDLFEEYDDEFRDVLTNPPLPDGTQLMSPGTYGSHRVLGYAKIVDNGTVRNATQQEIDSFGAAFADDQAQKEANKAEEYLENDPKFRRVMTALMAILVDEINTLRSQHGLPDRTLSQLKNAIKNRIDKDD